MKNAAEISLSLTEASRIYNWLCTQVVVEKLKAGKGDFEFEVLVPDAVITHSIIATVFVQGDMHHFELDDPTLCNCGCGSHDHW